MLPPTVICVSLLLAGVFAIPSPHHLPGHPPRAPNAPFKLCVPERAYKPCLKMLEQGKSAGINMQCIEARDRMDCIEKIENHSADWGAMDPEDMYVAAKFANDLFSVFKEIRTKEEPSSQFRYEAVAVIHKDLEINGLNQLQGLKSCHTGVGRNVGYKIPITKLTKMGILPPLNDTNISPRENELKALSTLFSKACLVGKWSPDPETNTYLKNKYNNLCALCQYPEKCDYPDDNSGYEGALNCLSKAGGDVAWTKIIYVKKFFGMAYGTQPARQVEVNPNDYAYLCPDATKKPLTGPPCTWAARPWQGYMANTEITGDPKELKELRDEIKTLNNIGETTHAEWISSVLALSNKTLAVDNEGPYSPKEYLDKAKYTDVIERDVMKPRRLVKLCVTSDVEKSKCLTLEKAAYSRDIRPQIECVQKSSQEECMNAVANKEADVLSIDAGFLKEAESKNLEPIASEIYESGKTNQYVVALVKKSSSFKSLNELKGAKACLSMKGEAAGWVTPINALLKKNAIQANDCPRTKSLSEFFSAVEQTKSAIECLMSGKDVAFVGCEELKMAKDNIKDFNPSDYNLIKLEGGDRCEIDKVEECNIGAAPARVLVSQKLKDLPHAVRDDILFTILAAGKTFSEDPEYFLMFGKYQNQPNILFSDFAKGFVNNQEAVASQEEFKKKLSEVGSCPGEKN